MRADETQLRAWMTRGLDGAAADHAALLRAVAPLLRNFYRRRIHSADEIEDLVQETLIAVHTRRATWDRDRAFTPWLFAIARYRMIDHFRRVRHHDDIDDLAHILATQGFEDESGAQMDVDGLLGELPAKQAYAIRATKLDGMSVADAAAAGGMGESDIKISVHRGMKKLAALIRGSEQ